MKGGRGGQGIASNAQQRDQGRGCHGGRGQGCGGHLAAGSPPATPFPLSPSRPPAATPDTTPDTPRLPPAHSHAHDAVPQV